MHLDGIDLDTVEWSQPKQKRKQKGKPGKERPKGDQSNKPQ
jgi:hypothetical protein